MKAGDLLYCYNTIYYTENVSNKFKNGNYYKIFFINKENVYINDELGICRSFSLKPTYYGLSYKTWFKSDKELRKEKILNLKDKIHVQKK